MLIIKELDKSTLKVATKILKNDGIICFATETVYALACSASSDLAIEKLYKIKERDPEKPIAVFVKDLKVANNFLKFNELEKKIAQNFMPGMITLVLEKKVTINQQVFISSLLNKGDNSLGLRIPNHQFCLELLNAFEGVIAVTSANISNYEPATDFECAAKYFQNKIDLLIDGGICEYKIASTVLRIINNQINILREGLVSKESLKKFNHDKNS
jgi:L-threonylcarbamoyladenylate synthase